MASLEQVIELVDPIWELQEDEPEDIYNIFLRYYLPFPLNGAIRAYNRYAKMHDIVGGYTINEQVANTGTDNKELSAFLVANASNKNCWAQWEKKFAWKKRHQAFHLFRGASNLEAVERRRSMQFSRILDIVDTLIERAREISQTPSVERQVTQVDEDGNPLVIILKPRSSKEYKEAGELLKIGQELIENYGVIGRTEKYISYLTTQGFDVTIADELPSQTPPSLLTPAEEEEES